MTPLQRFIVIFLGTAILTCTIELIRRRKLWEEYALLWLLSGTVILILGVFPQIISTISAVLGLAYLTTLLLIAFLFLLSIVMHFTKVISKQTEREVKLAQQLAILKMKLEKLEKGKKQDLENTSEYKKTAAENHCLNT